MATRKPGKTASPVSSPPPGPPERSVEGTDLTQLRAWVREHFLVTADLRAAMAKDFRYADGDQLNRADAAKLIKEGRPPLVMSELEPIIDLPVGAETDRRVDVVATPRGVEDRRLGEIATGTLKAAKDFCRYGRTRTRVFQDGIIGGLGFFEVLHTFDDPEDLLYGDTRVVRIPPLQAVWDPWAAEPDMQDAAYLGKASWESVKEIERVHGAEAVSGITSGDWLSQSAWAGTGLDDLGLPPEFQQELWDPVTRRVRVLTVWYKVPASVTVIVNEQTGEIVDVPSADAARQLLAAQAKQRGQESIARLSVVQTDQEAVIQDVETTQTAKSTTTGEPLKFQNAEAAQQALDQLANQAGLEVYDQLRVITRQAKVPRWVTLLWWKALTSGASPNRDRKYPYVPYVSRRYSESVVSIQGVIRQRWDRQDEVNKRYSQTLAHLNSTAHSGFLNPKTGGAKKQELEQMGSKPGVVVEYQSRPPSKIEPSALSPGHFALIQANIIGIQRTGGTNAETMGEGQQRTVSGKAVRARQQGGLTMLRPRTASFEDVEMDVAWLILSRIQQYWPVGKIKRVLGIAEAQAGLGPEGQRLFASPETGEPLPDEQIVEILKRLRTTKFDLALDIQPYQATEKQAQFERAVSIAGLVTSSGRPLGPQTMGELIELSDLSSGMAEAMKADMQQAANPALMGPGGQGQAVKEMVNSIRGGRSGGNEGS
jgi:hypothetical protein